MTSGDETHNNREPGHEAAQPPAREEEAKPITPRKTFIEQEAGRQKENNYFSHFSNWVSLLTLIFVCAYTVITCLQWRGNQIFNKKELRYISAQLAQMQSASNQTDQTIAALKAQATTMRDQLEETRKATINTGILANATIEAADAAKRSVAIEEVTERAWVAPVKFVFVNTADTDDPLRVRLFYQNVGREPAQDVKNWMNSGFIIAPPPLPPAIDWNKLSVWKMNTTLNPQTLCSHFGDVNTSVVVYPSSSFGFSIDTTKGHTIQSQIDDVRSEHAIYIIFGCFSYESEEHTRFSSFCAFLNPVGAGKDIAQWGFSACPTGNDDYTEGDKKDH
jgi:hypothetical protein